MNLFRFPFETLTVSSCNVAGNHRTTAGISPDEADLGSLYLALTFPALFRLPHFCPHPTRRRLKASLFSYHLSQVGHGIIISTYPLTEWEGTHREPAPHLLGGIQLGQHLRAAPATGDPRSRMLIFLSESCPGPDPLGGCHLHSSLNLVVLRYLCILGSFKNVVAEGETIKPSIAQLSLDKYTLPKVRFLSVLLPAPASA